MSRIIPTLFPPSLKMGEYLIVKNPQDGFEYNYRRNGSTEGNKGTYHQGKIDPNKYQFYIDEKILIDLQASISVVRELKSMYEETNTILIDENRKLQEENGKLQEENGKLQEENGKLQKEKEHTPVGGNKSCSQKVKKKRGRSHKKGNTVKTFRRV